VPWKALADADESAASPEAAPALQEALSLYRRLGVTSALYIMADLEGLAHEGDAIG
jgi:hypothetical protein